MEYHPSHSEAYLNMIYSRYPLLHTNRVSHPNNTTSARDAVTPETRLVHVARVDSRTDFHHDLVRNGGIANACFHINVRKLQVRTAELR